MTTSNGRTSWLAKATGSLILRLLGYYAVLIGAMLLVWRFLPRSELIAHEALRWRLVWQESSRQCAFVTRST
ncbi:MAG TPA: hypothetical protein VJN70_03350, partial [Gemmatimonadaceae bacterium]|nr:hypothetical protein [Gemmatimonadaceae bacterium]